MGKRRISTPSAREYIAEWRRDAAVDRGARWGKNDVESRRVREALDADRATIERLRDVIRGMTEAEARKELDRLLVLTRKLERGDGARLEQADGRVRLYAFVKSDRLTPEDRSALIKRLEG